MLQKVKSAYIVWRGYQQILQKSDRYSLGQRIDTLFIEVIEAVATAMFLVGEEKIQTVRLAVRKLDTLKILVMILWEVKSLDNAKYIDLSVKIDEVGKMLGGWSGQLRKQNSPDKGEK